MKKNSIENQKKTLALMVFIYCNGKKHNAPICPVCMELLEYAKERLDTCKYGIDKPLCSNCETHCYKPEMRERVKEAMRYSGPRMLYHYPIMALKHFL